MDFELTPEQKLIRDTARDLSQREIAPHAAQIDRSHEFPRKIFARLGEMGLLGIMMPEAWGGAGMDALSYVLAMEEVARACASTSVIMSVQSSLVSAPILAAGNDAQRARSDAKAQKTRAVRAGAGWILNGTKNFITNAPVADLALVFATTDPAKRSHGISAFLVPTGTPGFKVGPPDDKLGIRGAPSAQIFLTDCTVDDDARLGPEGDGFKIALHALDGGRIGIAAQALGIARAAFEDAVAYARERKTFGQPIAEHQAIQFKLADMRTEIDAARMLLWRAAVQKDSGRAYATVASMAKLFASEVANRAAKEAVQIFGGYGYLADFPVERHFRDAKITEIYEGTSEIQRMVIASALLKD
jgi:butyryl-CoA dehydrogenase